MVQKGLFKKNEQKVIFVYFFEKFFVHDNKRTILRKLIDFKNKMGFVWTTLK